MSRQIVILAAGKGTRMTGATALLLPKVLIPLREKPVILYLLNEMASVVRKTETVIVVGYLKERVQEMLGMGYVYAVQAEQKGTGHAVLSAQKFVNADNFAVLYGDMPFVTADSIQKLFRLHEQSGAKLSMFTALVPDFSGVYEHFKGFGRIIRDDNGQIQKIQEYTDCSESQRLITEVNPGIYVFSSAWVWPQLERIGSANAQGEVYLTDIVELAIQDGQIIESMAIAPEEIYGINTPDHLLHAETLISKKGGYGI